MNTKVFEINRALLQTDEINRAQRAAHLISVPDSAVVTKFRMQRHFSCSQGSAQVPIRTDADLGVFLNSLQYLPYFAALKARGRAFVAARMAGIELIGCVISF